MSKRKSSQACILMLITEGFEENEMILLSTLRQAGLCVKSVSLTSGLINSAHGVWLRPDMTLSDLDQRLNTMSVSLVILPNGRQSVRQIGADPRVHRLLRQVIAQQGHIVTGPEGLSIFRGLSGEADTLGGNGLENPIILRESTISVETFAMELVRRMMG